MQFSIVETTLLIVLAALIVSVVFRSLRLPVVLGYLVVGAVVGPHVLAWLPDPGSVTELAEFGVVLLMFTIGLEFSLSKLIDLRHSVFLLGGLQVTLSIAVTLVLGLLLNMTWVQSLVIGCVVAMSSTAIVSKQLAEQFDLQSKHGRNAIGILLFQDLAVIPMMVLIASLSSTTQVAVGPTIFWALAKGVLAIGLILGAGRWLLRPLFHMIAETRIIELFTLSVLFIAVGSAWLTHALGISYALGAFLAGIMLGETEFRHQITVEIRPFRDVLLGLFFVSIGMLAHVTTWGETWLWITLLLVALLIGKTVLITLLCRALKCDWPCATRTGVILSQGGEFGFVLLTLALANGLLPADYGQVVLAALLISFALAPIIIQFNKTIAHGFFPEMLAKHQKNIKEQIASVSKPLSDHIIICGYGRVGQSIARFLEQLDKQCIGLDLDPDIIRRAQQAGDLVAYGNATHLDILTAAKLDKAAALVVCFDEVDATLSIIQQVRRHHPELPILVRCRDDAEFDALRESGATIIVTEVFEESLSMLSHLLHLIHLPDSQITQFISEMRDKKETRPFT